MSTKVINIKKENLTKHGYDDLQNWLEDPNHIYIGRNMSFYVKGATKSKWNNPFAVKKYGRDKCLELYKEYIESNEQLMADLPELKGKTLGCWCHPDKCHGDILLELLNSPPSTDKSPPKIKLNKPITFTSSS